MKIHSDTLTRLDVASALDAAIASGNVEPHIQMDLIQVGSRKRSHAFEVRLYTYSGGKGTTHPRRPNPGTGPRNNHPDQYAATYDDWGWFIAVLFERDADAIVGQYPTLENFEQTTSYRYELVPA